MRLREIMTETPTTIPPETSVAQARAETPGPLSRQPLDQPPVALANVPR